jgi:hypothetical protein
MGQKLLLKAVGKKPRLISMVGALRGVVPQLEDRGLAERYAPGGSPAKTMLRITHKGRDALEQLKD